MTDFYGMETFGKITVLECYKIYINKIKLKCISQWEIIIFCTRNSFLFCNT